MRISSLLASLLLLCCSSGCGKEIGDECVISSDCSPNADRQCDTSSKEGYCTIQGCDFDTCPDEAVCVRFFTGSFTNKLCDPGAEDVTPGVDVCSLDELCSLAGTCVARASEVRFCMRKCESSGDCRDGYECRDQELMKMHGGQLVPGSDETENFCAVAPTPG